MKFLEKLHEKIGDFWWYSLILFAASRAADLLNAFVGLYLVPKYIPPSELGAVLPLMNFASFLALPMAVFTSTFRNEISTLSIRGEFGKLKTLMRGVFIASAIFLFFAIVASHFFLPHFLERIRIVEGSIGILILSTSFVNAVTPVYTNAMQALKKFRATTIINLVSSPIRLVTMLLAMPLRPLAGYFAGQISTPVFNIAMSVFSLRKELSVKAEPYWTKEVSRRLGRLFLVFAASGATGGFLALVETTVLRQRLPEVDSAAYYMVTRFSDISTFLYCTLIFTIFPFTAELAAKGKDTRPLILKTSLALTAFSAVVAAVFGFSGEFILKLLPHGDEYASYWWAIPWIIGINTMGTIVGVYTTAEVSANRFGYLKWMIPLCLCYPLSLLFVTGYGYFAAYLPPAVMEAVAKINPSNLSDMLCWMTAIGAIRLICCGVDLFLHNPRTRIIN